MFSWETRSPLSLLKKEWSQWWWCLVTVLLPGAAQSVVLCARHPSCSWMSYGGRTCSSTPRQPGQDLRRTCDLPSVLSGTDQYSRPLAPICPITVRHSLRPPAPPQGNYHDPPPAATTVNFLFASRYSDPTTVPRTSSVPSKTRGTSSSLNSSCFPFNKERERDLNNFKSPAQNNFNRRILWYAKLITKF